MICSISSSNNNNKDDSIHVHVCICLFVIYLPVNFQTLIIENKMISKMTKGEERGGEGERGGRGKESNNFKISLSSLLVLYQPVSVWCQNPEKVMSF